MVVSARVNGTSPGVNKYKRQTRGKKINMTLISKQQNKHKHEVTILLKSFSLRTLETKPLHSVTISSFIPQLFSISPMHHKKEIITKRFSLSTSPKWHYWLPIIPQQCFYARHVMRHNGSANYFNCHNKIKLKCNRGHDFGWVASLRISCFKKKKTFSFQRRHQVQEPIKSYVILTHTHTHT